MIIPRWQRELSIFAGTKSIIILEGNIHDKYPVYDNQGDCRGFMPLDMCIERLLNRDKTYDVFQCNPIDGIINTDPSTNVNDRLLSYGVSRDILKSNISSDFVGLSEVVKHLLTTRYVHNNQEQVDDDNQQAILFIANYASRYISNSNSVNENEKKMFLNLLEASKKAQKTNGRKHSIVLITDRIADLPIWFYNNNPNIRNIMIPCPEKETRRMYFNSNNIDYHSNRLLDITDGMKICDFDGLQMLLRKEDTGLDDLADTLYLHRYGIKDDKWKLLDRDKILNIKSNIEKRVIGQKNAVKKATEVIIRAAAGLSGAQNSSGEDKPRGVLFLAGPSGVGKTELAKTLAEILFGDEKACVRFDMSEYDQQHAAQKLFGAPPGYVGYESGGQLTNAVRERPFCVLLFDEIEKAHTSVMDKFLQILEDGRMTDGQGNTVYFSQTLIVFTSNLGITEEYDDNGMIKKRLIVTPDNTYEEIVDSVKDKIKEKLKTEVRNRIGDDNIVVFNFIDPISSNLIVDKMITNIKEKIEKQYNIKFDITQSCRDYYYSKALLQEYRELGGRGIGNMMENYFINGVSQIMIKSDFQYGQLVEMDYIDNEIVIEAKNVG